MKDVLLLLLAEIVAQRGGKGAGRRVTDAGGGNGSGSARGPRSAGQGCCGGSRNTESKVIPAGHRIQRSIVVIGKSNSK